MRRCYLVCYDICDGKRLRHVFKIMKGYGEHWQYSIFFCILKPIDRVRMQGDLEDVMKPNCSYARRLCFHLASDAADSVDRLPASNPSTLMSSSRSGQWIPSPLPISS